MIKGIPQRLDWDCAVATTAMAAQVSYRESFDATRRLVYKMRFGLLSNEQIRVLRALTGGDEWEEWTPSSRMWLRDMQIRVVRDGSPDEEDAARFIISTRRVGKPHGHSLFSTGTHIYDPKQANWFSFAEMRRMPHFKDLYIQAIITQAGTFQQSD